MTKILIADDHTVVRAGIRQIIAADDELVVVGEAINAQETLVMASVADCDLILLDITMPGVNGLDLLRELKRRHPKLPVLILSMHPEEQYAINAFRANASGYVTKESASDELLHAIRKVASGGKYVSVSLAEKLASKLATPSSLQHPHETLSKREYQVLCRIATGQKLTEIAEDLGLNPKSVATYRNRILKKMKLKSNAELTCYAMQHDLIDLR